MGKFSQDFDVYETENTLSEKEKNEKILNAYANFCVNFVTSLSGALNLKQSDREENKNGKKILVKTWEIEIPYAKKQTQKHKNEKIIKPIPTTQGKKV